VFYKLILSHISLKKDFVKNKEHELIYDICVNIRASITCRSSEEMGCIHKPVIIQKAKSTFKVNRTACNSPYPNLKVQAIFLYFRRVWVVMFYSHSPDQCNISSSTSVLHKHIRLQFQTESVHQRELALTIKLHILSAFFDTQII
jgi:hypothetical protein